MELLEAGLELKVEKHLAEMLMAESVQELRHMSYIGMRRAKRRRRLTASAAVALPSLWRS